MDNFTNRDKIRFMEIFKDYTENSLDAKEYVMIKKREQNPELSVFSNLVLDLIDFKDRIRPMARDIALMDVASKYEKNNIIELQKEREQMMKEIDDINAHGDKGAKIDRGYSSGELEPPKKK
jgi:hypothetical protein